jgi:hypothetical protein
MVRVTADKVDQPPEVALSTFSHIKTLVQAQTHYTYAQQEIKAKSL